MNDLISRQAAVEALEIPKVIDLYDHYWNGRNDQYKKDVDVINNLPSAQHNTDYSDGYADGYKQGMKDTQPEIIRCKDCRWGREACGNIECFADTNVPPEYHGYEWFCPNGERRTDE